jgi:hypothetical protein
VSLIGHPLTYICNHSLFTWIFPESQDFKSKTTGGEEDRTSRPISLLTSFSKVLEKVMYSRLSHDLQTNNILVPEQSGFRK